MTAQYLRNLSLVVANPGGKGLELGSLRVRFEVRRGDTQTPNSCDAWVYNLSDATAHTISTEFTQLALKVSYGSAPPQAIFQGSIKQVRKGREDMVNTYVAITAADGDHAYNFSALARTLAAGATPQNSVEVLIQQMAAGSVSTPTGGSGGQEISQGYTPTLNPNPYVRGVTHYGLCRDEMRELALNNNCKWWVQNGEVELVPLTGYVPQAPVLITPATGLVGIPEVTQNGLRMRVLMNPNILIGRVVQLQSADVNAYRFGLDRQSQPVNALLAASGAKLNSAGLYYVLRAEHFGDSRNRDWYTDLTCLAVDATVSNAQVQGAAVVPPFPSTQNAVPLY